MVLKHGRNDSFLECLTWLAWVVHSYNQAECVHAILLNFKLVAICLGPQYQLTSINRVFENDNFISRRVYDNQIFAYNLQQLRAIHNRHDVARERQINLYDFKIEKIIESQEAGICLQS